NRPDCLCMLGMAREAAATFDEKMRYPETECEKTDEDAKDYIQVEVRSDLCKRYTARVVKDVKIGQSPWWMQKRLMAAGMRPINNIVDITNFVMLEYGQPLHAFDINHLEGRKIIVDTAEEGENFTTLDGTERTLHSDMLMIRDKKKPVAVAGVMGGLNSEITDATDTVVLESAAFVGSSVRLTAKALGLRTEASSRIEKGLDPNNCEAAADRFCRLVEMLGCGKVLNGSVDVYPVPEKAPVVTARVSRINKVLGTDISREQMVSYLEKLEMKVEGEGDSLVVTPPTVRQDLLEEVDYVEEVARMYGYDNIPMTLPALSAHPFVSDSWALREKARKLLTGMGATEIQTLSFSNQKVLDRAGVTKDAPIRDMVKLINPMGEDTECMRSILLPNMLDVLATNYSRNIERVRAFEIAVTFHRNPEGDDVLPIEKKDLSIGFYGEKESFFTLKGVIERLLERLGVHGTKYEKKTEFPTFHPGRCARITAETEDGERVLIGLMGEVHPDVLENYGIGERAYGAELFFDRITEIAKREIHYERLPQFPSTSRDIALVVDEKQEVGAIEDVIRSSDVELFDDVKLFDIYRGIPIPPGKKSCAFSITYRSPDRTLTDQEADEAHRKMTELLVKTFRAEVRE
ncbi:MAG: phenylalanine--tRNA ligase subunit beta, partial [Eubacteriales bacterium]|nr:phenylalanine--tRNA ligase subunit beta [Eubacteriales bacterium]